MLNIRKRAGLLQLPGTLRRRNVSGLLQALVKVAWIEKHEGLDPFKDNN